MKLNRNDAWFKVAKIIQGEERSFPKGGMEKTDKIIDIFYPQPKTKGEN